MDFRGLSVRVRPGRGLARLAPKRGSMASLASNGCSMYNAIRSARAHNCWMRIQANPNVQVLKFRKRTPYTWRLHVRFSRMPGPQACKLLGCNPRLRMRISWHAEFYFRCRRTPTLTLLLSVLHPLTSRPAPLFPVSMGWHKNQIISPRNCEQSTLVFHGASVKTNIAVVARHAKSISSPLFARRA
jgi:hypothetical protein